MQTFHINGEKREGITKMKETKKQQKTSNKRLSLEMKCTANIKKNKRNMVKIQKTTHQIFTDAHWPNGIKHQHGHINVVSV